VLRSKAKNTVLPNLDASKYREDEEFAEAPEAQPLIMEDPVLDRLNAAEGDDEDDRDFVIEGRHGEIAVRAGAPRTLLEEQAADGPIVGADHGGEVVVREQAIVTDDGEVVMALETSSDSGSSSSSSSDSSAEEDEMEARPLEDNFIARDAIPDAIGGVQIRLETVRPKGRQRPYQRLVVTCPLTTSLHMHSKTCGTSRKIGGQCTARYGPVAAVGFLGRWLAEGRACQGRPEHVKWKPSHDQVAAFLTAEGLLLPGAAAA